MTKVEDSTGGVEGDEGEARPFASAAEMAEALAAEPLAREFAASSFGGTMTAAEMAALAEESAQSLRRRLSENISAAEMAALAEESAQSLRRRLSENISAAESVAHAEETARERMAALAEDSRQPARRAEEAARERFSSSLIATGYTPASALLGSFRHSPLRALGVVESPVFREIRAAREARSIISPEVASVLRRQREFRELTTALVAGRSLGLVRSAQRYEAPPAPPPAPPAPPPKDASTLRKERAAAAAAKRGEELRALAPAEMLKKLRVLKSKGRALAKIAGDYGMSAAELHALVSAARQAVRARKPRKRT